MSTATESSNATSTLVPPDESLWKRYSPHHEAPLSGISSVALHVLAFGGIAMIALIDAKCNDPDALDLEKRSASADNAKVVHLPVTPVKVTDGGGGGNRDGTGKDHGGTKDGPDVPPERGTLEGKKDARGPDTPPIPNHPTLTPAQQQGLKETYNNDPNVVRLIQRGTDAFKAMSQLNEDVRKALRRAVNPGAGGGGVGRDGGRDAGKDKGTGPGDGPGTGALTQREKRMLRWSVKFKTYDARDYIRQLQGFGAILAFPAGREQEGRYLVLRDLSQPRSAREEDVTSLDRIFWVDNVRRSVDSLCDALSLPRTREFVAFFPKSVEDRFLQVELAYLKQVHRLENEDLIEQTEFEIIEVGGRFDVQVKSGHMTLHKGPR
jgi:hypothetical protein